MSIPIFRDALDYKLFEIYEIKPSHLYQDGEDELYDYLRILDSVPEIRTLWHPGDTYVPPSSVVYLNEVILIHPPIRGVITYDSVNQKEDPVRSIVGDILKIIFFSYILQFKQLEQATATASALASHGVF
jgi:hypothetical protein